MTNIEKKCFSLLYKIFQTEVESNYWSVEFFVIRLTHPDIESQHACVEHIDDKQCHEQTGVLRYPHFKVPLQKEPFACQALLTMYPSRSHLHSQGLT